ncbi:type II secretion system protein [Sulfurovum sp. ST-21]|uniref:type II secretion system protein n=1 Tax=Sulfurovum TaxID=265570 RepID=UPI001E430784
MIELIFVIVIVGILALIAIPRLNASRDDAKASAELLNLAIKVKDISTYYMATGEGDVNRSSVNVKCFDIALVDMNGTLSISVSDGGEDNGEDYCTAAQEAARNKNLSREHLVTIGGTLVKY